MSERINIGIRNGPLSSTEVIIGLTFILLSGILLALTHRIQKYIYTFSGNALGVLLMWSISNAIKPYKSWNQSSLIAVIIFIILFSIALGILGYKIERVGTSWLGFLLGIMMGMIIFQYIPVSSTVRIVCTIIFGILMLLFHCFLYIRLPDISLFNSCLLGSLFLCSGLDCFARQGFVNYLNDLKYIKQDEQRKVYKPTFEAAFLCVLIPLITFASYYIQTQFINRLNEKLKLDPQDEANISIQMDPMETNPLINENQSHP